ncbi:MAG TPA: polysaccharide deacetylase family protein [Patescibacteria group bacterium]|nr:polysaccharide deacetylase family protein [Patescibacteria group bacterium]
MRKKLLLLLIGTAIILVIAFELLPRFFIYPPLHRNTPSPADYIARQKNILTGTSISLVVWEHGDRAVPRIALTFDADMTPGMRFLLDQGVVKSWYNREIKKTLDRERVPATIFLGGLWTKTYPMEAKALANDPFIELGNHSYNHYAFTAGCYNLPFLSASKEKTDDVAEAQRIIQITTGVSPKYFRFPGGCFEHVDLETVAKLGLSIVHWDVVAGDGFNTDTDSIVQAVESGVQNGSIVVFHIHDGPYAPKTNDALMRIIPDLKKRNFQFVKISELLPDAH